jgi:hypothetical protein
MVTVSLRVTAFATDTRDNSIWERAAGEADKSYTLWAGGPRSEATRHVSVARSKPRGALRTSRICTNIGGVERPGCVY